MLPTSPESSQDRYGPSSASILALSLVLLALDAVTLGIRLLSRRCQRRALCLNDFAAVLALVWDSGLIDTPLDLTDVIAHAALCGGACDCWKHR